MQTQTVFLDAGGVLVFPNWVRVSETLGRHGVHVSAGVLAAAEPRAKKRLDTGQTIQATNDQQRGWTYFNLVLAEAGIELSDATEAALAELHAYHQTSNLWETVPDDVRPALAALRSRGFRLVVVSNANGTLHRAFARLGLTSSVDALFDSYDEGVEKPDPRFFHIALDRSSSRPDSTVHVGDLYHVDVVGARAAGIGAILLDAAGLYDDCDCPRVRTLSGLVEWLDSAVGLGSKVASCASRSGRCEIARHVGRSLEPAVDTVEKILVSACLLGAKVRYHGGDAASDHPILRRWMEEGRLVVACPERDGGLPTPRPAAEIVGGDGHAVVASLAKVTTSSGADVTAAFRRGAEAALQLAQHHRIRVAVLKDGSPSCGSSSIYDGSFSGTRFAGQGVTAALLEAHGVRVFSETAIEAANAWLEELKERA